MPEFEEFKKIPRLFRDCVVTEKIDGTNGQICIERDPHSNGAGERTNDGVGLCVYDDKAGEWYSLRAGSRNRWIVPGKTTDSSGFATWAFRWAQLLVEILGEGRHYGEWWGAGIQRGYGLAKDDKRFSLFNTSKWTSVLRVREIDGLETPKGLGVVPVLYDGPFLTREVEDQLFRLRNFGSQCSPGFMDAEGVVVYHVAAGSYFKATCHNDEKPKGRA